MLIHLRVTTLAPIKSTATRFFHHSKTNQVHSLLLLCNLKPTTPTTSSAASFVTVTKGSNRNWHKNYCSSSDIIGTNNNSNNHLHNLLPYYHNYSSTSFAFAFTTFTNNNKNISPSQLKKQGFFTSAAVPNQGQNSLDLDPVPKNSPPSSSSSTKKLKKIIKKKVKRKVKVKKKILSNTVNKKEEKKTITTKMAKSKFNANAKKGTTKKKTTVKAKTKTTKKRTTKQKQQENDFPSVPFISKKLLPEWMNQERTRVLTQPVSMSKIDSDSDNDTSIDESDDNNNTYYSCVYYWMQRDMRTVDNWALLFAQHLAQVHNIPLHVLYVLPCVYTPPTLGTAAATSTANSDDDSLLQLPPKVCEIQMTQRHASFLIGGLKVVQEELMQKDVSFHVLKSSSHSKVGQTVHDFVMNDGKSAGTDAKPVVVCDMNPLRQYRNWVEEQATPLMEQSGVPFYQVDAHNIVPVWFASPKREVGARTLRPKINKLLPEFLTHFPDFDGNEHLKTLNDSTTTSSTTKSTINWDECLSYLNCDDSVPSLPWAEPGRKAAMKRFEEFCSSKTQGLKNFDSLRNDPNYSNVCSNLSPWVNYGMVSFQRLALEVRALKKYPNGTASYIEEGIVRRELSDNFVYYAKDNYDELTCAAGWAQETLQVHTQDEREYLYTLEELETSNTHDDLWNAAQIQLVTEGTMHGFLRMYWAKKILEWTKSPEVALRTGLYFNDRYALDGNDPNGFTGVGWSVMGIHDMGWKERPIFGKIRFMNYAGCKRKFKVDTFVAKYNKAKVNPMKSGTKQRKKSKSTVGKKRKVSS